MSLCMINILYKIISYLYMQSNYKNTFAELHKIF